MRDIARAQVSPSIRSSQCSHQSNQLQCIANECKWITGARDQPVSNEVMEFRGCCNVTWPTGNLGAHGWAAASRGLRQTSHGAPSHVSHGLDPANHVSRKPEITRMRRVLCLIPMRDRQDVAPPWRDASSRAHLARAFPRPWGTRHRWEDVD
jgi:hypothetical protein